VQSSMLHGSETWPVRKENEVALQRAEMRMVRGMYGVKVEDRVPMMQHIQTISQICVGGFLRIRKTKQKLPIGAIVKFLFSFASEKIGEGSAQIKTCLLN